MNFSIYFTLINDKKMYGIVDELNNEVILPEYDYIEEISDLNSEGKYYFRVGKIENNNLNYRTISINITSPYYIKVKEKIGKTEKSKVI